MKGTDKFGWCMTAQHEDCPESIWLSMQNKTINCGCECHEEE